MKLKCLKLTWFDSDFNESGTYETKFSVDGSEYLYYDYSDYHSGEIHIKNLTTGEIDGDNQIFETLDFLAQNYNAPLKEIEVGEIIDTTLFDVEDLDVDIRQIEGAVTRE
jgi:hypothetical protein